MGKFAYSLAIYLYGAIIRLASLFNAKAKLFVDGRKNIWKKLAEIYPKENVVWFHAASLGEFEQGKPVLEALKKARPELHMLVTFFSPSGYENQKDYSFADVFYLPLDTPSNAKKFIAITQPFLAVFIRYEFWANYMDELYKNKIPTTVISAQFRSNQFAFGAFGGFIKKRIKQLDLILVQYETAKKLLVEHGFDETKIHVCGDSRFDRVLLTVADAEALVTIARFKGNSPILILGSGYQHEEEFVYQAYHQFPNWKFVYAPHFVDEGYIQKLTSRLPGPAVLYTNYQSGSERILVLNTIGKLASTYKYGNIAVVGGGFRDGIHNIIEPMAFGLPTFFGPNHMAFPEANAAIDAGIAWEIDKGGKAAAKLESLMTNPEELIEIKGKAQTFVTGSSGATACITKHLKQLIQ